MACGLLRFCVRGEVTGISFGMRRLPTALHKCVTKRYIEFKFSPEKSHEGGTLLTRIGVWLS
jgi:hypothetical protein